MTSLRAVLIQLFLRFFWCILVYFSISVFQQHAAAEAHGARREPFEGAGYRKRGTRIINSSSYEAAVLGGILHGHHCPGS